MNARHHALRRMAAQQVPEPAELDGVAPARHRSAVLATILADTASLPQGRLAIDRDVSGASVAGAPLRPRRSWLVASAAVAVVVVLVVVGLLSALVPGAGPATAAATDTLVRAAAAAIGSEDEPLAPGQFRYIGTRSWNLGDFSGAPGGPYLVREENVFDVWVPADPTQEWLLDRRPTGRREWIVGSEEQARAAGIPLDQMGSPTDRITARCGDFYPSGVLGDRCTGPGAWPAPTPRFLDGLPRDPAALLDRLQHDAPDNGRGDAELLVYAADLLRTGLVPADLRSALYLALSRLDGLTVTEGAVNLDGRSGTALGIDDEFGRQEIIVDPTTGVFIGEREVSSGDGDDVPAGAVRSYSSVRTAVVDALGALPS